ncbi:Uncharacterised protein g2022 [Pycnogonum litorale]
MCCSPTDFERMSDDEEQKAAPTVPISHFSIKVPPFYRNNVNAWFRQVESQFILANITSEKTKFYHSVANLPEDIAALVLHDYPVDKYGQLKENIPK